MSVTYTKDERHETGGNPRLKTLTEFSDEARVLVEGIGEVLEEHGIVFSGHVAELGDTIAVELGVVAEIDLDDRQVFRVVVDVGGGHFVICLDGNLVW